MAPITVTGQFVTAFASVARMMPSSEAGKRAFSFLGQKIMVRMTMRPSATACQSAVTPPRK